MSIGLYFLSIPHGKHGHLSGVKDLVISSGLQIRGCNVISKYKISRIIPYILCCLFSLESSRLDDSNEYPQHSI